MKLNKYILLGAVALGFISCNNEQLNLTTGQLSFRPVFDDASVSTKSGLELQSPNGETCFTLEPLPATKSYQINDEDNFVTVYNGSFEVEGSVGGNKVFHANAVYNNVTELWDLQDSDYEWKPYTTLEVVAAASNFDNTDFFDGIYYGGTPSSSNFDYSLPEIQNQKDLLVGYFKGEVNEDGCVSLKFNHPLTSLVFKVGRLPVDAHLTVNSISLSGIDASAHCVASFDHINGSTYQWSNYAGRINYKQTVETPTAQNPGDVIFDGTSAFIVIPRRFPDDTEAKIIINITENGRDYDIYTSLAGHEWKPGETNVYALSYHGDNKAILTSGPNFRRAMLSLAPNANSIHKVEFIPNSTVTTDTQVQAPGARTIYMSYANNTISVYTDDYEIYTGSSCESMFSGLQRLTSIEGMEFVSTKDAVSMKQMFYNCKAMTSFPIEHFDTRKVETMAQMFQECDGITSIDLSPLSSESLVNAELMFRNASNLRTIVFGEQFTCKYVESWGFIFAETPITTLDWSHITPEHAGDIEYMFSQCYYLTTIDMSPFAGSNETIYFAAGLFGSATRLTSLNMGLMDFRALRDHTTAINDMMSNTASNNVVPSHGCTVTCLQVVKDIMESPTVRIGRDWYGPRLNPNKFTWNIITPEP